ncbi:hypothetical protein HK101_000950 [Irineochytrium annulatum]|nr:hypothetical protein HK101_000950 [Irineochytrium annulatum]
MDEEWENGFQLPKCPVIVEEPRGAVGGIRVPNTPPQQDDIADGTDQPPPPDPDKWLELGLDKRRIDLRPRGPE